MSIESGSQGNLLYNPGDVNGVKNSVEQSVDYLVVAARGAATQRLAIILPH